MNKDNIKVILITVFIMSLLFSILFIKMNNKWFNEKSFQLLNANIEYSEKEILTNTIILIPSYINDYGKIQYKLHEKIFNLINKWGLSKEEELLLSKYYYLIWLDIHDLKLRKYNEHLWIDKEILNIIEAIVN
jgi:hypothetical protein